MQNYLDFEKGLAELRRKATEWNQFSKAINLVMEPER